MNKNDAFIQSQVEETIKDTRFLHNADINIETRNGKVTLSGFVDVLAEKWAAGEIIRQIPGVVSVDNSLTVAMDRSLEDSSISELIQEKLNVNQLADVTAVVKNGVAYLQGRVETLAAGEDAKEIAAGVRGVKDVISYLGFEQGDIYTDDATVTNAVETALSRSIAVSARDVETNDIRNELGNNGLGGVKCFVVDRTAFLEDAVGDPDQKEKAEEVVSRFDGVEGINNDIQVH